MSRIRAERHPECKTTSDPPALAIYMPSLVGGGAERVMVNLALGFAERGLPLHMVLARAHGPLLEQVRAHPGIRVFDLGASRTIGSLVALSRYLRQVKPPCLISALDHANLVALFANRLSRKPVRLIVTVHNQRSSGTANSREVKVHVLPLMMRLCYPWAHKVVAVSQGVADDLVERIGLDRSNVTTIYNPVVSEKLLEMADREPDHPWMNDPLVPTILAAGRLAKQKDFETLVRAFEIVQRERNARLVILGEGPERRKLEDLIIRLGLEGQISMPGYVENPYAYLKRARAFVLSSRWEGLPTVLIEALALGVPLVSTDCPSGPREILGEGKFGKLVPVGDVRLLASAIIESLDGRASSGRAEESERFHTDTSVKSYLAMGQIGTRGREAREDGATDAGIG